MKRERTLQISLICAAGTALLLLYLLAIEPKALQLRAAERQGEMIEQGAGLYAMHCRSCHGLRGEGVGQLGPALSDASFFAGRLAEVGYGSTLKSYILSTTEHGRMMGTRPYYAGNGSTMVMPPWHQAYGGPLRADELESLASFLLNWEATATGEVVLAELELPKSSPGDAKTIERGKAVFAEHCGRCHTVHGAANGGSSGPDLTGIAGSGGTGGGKDAETYIRESVLIPARHVVKGYEAAAEEHPCGAVLTETELTALTAYLLR